MLGVYYYMKNIHHLFLLFTFIFSSVDYNTEIQPIFNNNCGNCHLGNSSGGLNLSNYNNLMSADVVEPGDHEDSELYDRITRDNSDAGDMPPGNSELTQSQIDLIALWIDEGALEFPASECDDGYTYYENIPENTCIVFDGSNCFLNEDIQVLQDIVGLNNLEFGNNPLYLGTQNWLNGRITRLLVGHNSSGGMITLSIFNKVLMEYFSPCII